MAVLPVAATATSTGIVAPTFDTTTGAGTAGTGAAGQSLFAQGLQQVQALQDSADAASTGVATGTITNIHDFTVAAAKAQLGVQLTVALRDKAVEAYQEIMRMQI